MQDEVFIDHAGQHRYEPPKLREQTQGPRPNTEKPRESRSLPAAQTVVQLNIYRDVGDHYEYLLLRRIDEDKQFWQVVTQPVSTGSTIADSLREAVAEQTGIHGFRHLSHESYSYEWYAGDERGRDIVFAAEVSPQATVRYDGTRYNTFAWLPAAEAVQRLKWNGNKQALHQLDEHLQRKRMAAQKHEGQSEPVTAEWTGPAIGRARPDGGSAVSKEASAQDAATVDTADHTNHSPYGNNVPKRLPERPEDGIDDLKVYNGEDDERTGEWFL